MPPHDSQLHDLNAVFLAATSEERRLILLNLDFAAIKAADPVDTAQAAGAIRRLEVAALSHDSASFATELARALTIAADQARRLTYDDSGEPLVVAALALAMPAGVLQRILLCLNPAISQSVQRVYELVTLYEDLEPQAALRMLSIWRAAAKAEPVAAPQPPHQSYYWHVESSRAPAPAMPQAQPGTRPKIAWDEHAKRQA